MKKYISHTLLSLSVMLSINTFARELTCPPENKVKSVKLTQAIQHPYDKDLWDFISTPFIHDGVAWNVTFGTFFPGTQTTEEALKKGQTYFDQSPLVIKDPEPIQIPHFILCDYMPTGRPYWISAVSPPEKQVFKFSHSR